MIVLWNKTWAQDHVDKEFILSVQRDISRVEFKGLNMMSNVNITPSKWSTEIIVILRVLTSDFS